MGIVAVAGDSCTTTAVALASAWPVSQEGIIAESETSVADAPRVAAADGVPVVLIEPGSDPATEGWCHAGGRRLMGTV